MSSNLLCSATQGVAPFSFSGGDACYCDLHSSGGSLHSALIFGSISQVGKAAYLISRCLPISQWIQYSRIIAECQSVSNPRALMKSGRIRYTSGLLDISGKVCYNVFKAGQTAREILTNERVKTMKAIMNNAVCLFSFEYQQFCYFLQQENGAFVLHAKHTGVCSASLTG